MIEPFINELPEAAKVVARVRYRQEHYDLAKELGISRQAVQMSLNRGIELLKRSIPNREKYQIVCEVERYARKHVRSSPGQQEFHWITIGSEQGLTVKRMRASCSD